MILILGGGLSGSLLAYRLSLLPGPPDFFVIETREVLDWSQTWCFQDSDLDLKTLNWVEPLVVRSWTRQEVRFPTYQRLLDIPYHAITSKHLVSKVQRQLGPRLKLGKKIHSIRGNEVILANGEKFVGDVIFDARGLDAGSRNSDSARSCLQAGGYQKFVGLDVELENPHGLEHPLIMDACGLQKNGYCFFYVLPWSPTELLVEDTRYVLGAEIDFTEFQESIKAYCEKSNWKIKKIVRRESASLPIPWEVQSRSELNPFLIQIGMKGGYFNFTTGYSLPYAAQVAERLSKEIESNLAWSSLSLVKCLDPFRLQVEKQNRFFALLNRFLFLAAKPDDSWKIFSRFYRFRERLISNFYRGELTLGDRLRILSGKPPVPVLKAIRYLRNSSFRSVESFE